MNAKFQQRFFWTYKLPLVDKHGASILSVQHAVDNYLEPKKVDDIYRWRCQSCRSTLPPWKKTEITHHPHTLVLQLMRWGEQQRMLKHAVVPDRTLSVDDKAYTLKSIICHQGSTVQSGHYTARIHHPTANGEFWYYNNTMRRLATERELQTDGPEQHCPERSYVLIYDRHT